MNNPARYWHTLKYLKPIQLWYRLWFQVYKPALRQIPLPPVRTPAWKWKSCFRSPSMLNRATFQFLNQSHDLKFPAAWTDAALPALWIYNLHYFDDLVAQDAAERKDWHAALIEQWIAENPPATGVGWDSYPTSLRIVNWTKWHLGGNAHGTGLLESLALQARWLNRRIEYHLQANHLWANAKALLFAGVLFDDDEAAGWRIKGERLIEEQLDIQILGDGGHFERSPMYHAIVLEDMLDLLQLAAVFPGVMSTAVLKVCEEKTQAMLVWLAAMTHPDTKIALFNDTAQGIAPDISSLTSYATSIRLSFAVKPLDGLTQLPSSGYVRAQNSSMVLLCDVGEVGPDFQPGHGHADTLSCEASLFGTRLLVNSGIDTYEPGEERLYQRGSAAHNTVEVDGENSSEVWGSFRLARRARPFGFAANQSAGKVAVTCSHDGFGRLAGKVMHNRQWELHENKLEIVDTMTGNYRTAVGRFHLHPDVEIVAATVTGCDLKHSGQLVRFKCDGGVLEVVTSSYHPEFGKTLQNQCLLVRFTQPQCKSRFSWHSANHVASPSH